MSATPSKPASLEPQRLADQRDLFHPPWMLRNGHVQTLAGAYLFDRWPNRYALPKSTSTIGEVDLGDGDRLSFHEDCPADWQPGDRIALLLHGLAGSHDSPYMRRIASLLYRRRVRTVRLNWRGCGTGMSLARYPYHSGRTEDLRAAVVEFQQRFPHSPISLIGFSMGGNIALKFLGETSAIDGVAASISRAVAVCPPIDLSVTVDFLRNGLARWYDSYFTRVCIGNVRRRLQARSDVVIPDGWFSRLPRGMREFDDSFTAPVCGFASAAEYYARCSANQFLPNITVPTLIIAAQDDPVVPYTPYSDAKLSPVIELLAPKYGGHLGFVAGGSPRWLDREVIDWTLGGRTSELS